MNRTFTPFVNLHSCLLAAAALAQATSIQADAAAFLVQDGKSAYRILLPEGASPSEQLAATELQQYFEKCSDVSLTIVNEPAELNAPSIFLGLGAAAATLGVSPTPDQLGEQGYVIRTVPPHLVIAGTPAAGTLYGVYDFLEKHLGVRWYAPGVTKTPHVSELPLPQEDRLVKPGFAWRHTSYDWPGGDEAFRTLQRDNSGSGGPDHPFAVQHNHDGRCHSYFRYISPDEFFDTHPEYFSEIGGVRRNYETQLCLTNPDVLEIVTERMLQRMADMPGVRQHNFSQMDYYNYCECAKCTEINRKYGTLGGTQYWFLNQLAERTAKVYPDKLIGTLAYMYTEEPPKGLEIHPNIAVWLCHMFPSCDSHPIADCPLNTDYKRRAIAWSALCKHLYIWHYIVDFAHYYNPFPNLRAMAADMRFYHDIGVEGVYLQGMGHGGGGGEFSLLRPYYGMKLLWDPTQDADALMRDFLDGYYGPAALPIQDYITLLHDKVTNEDIHMHLYTNPAQGYLPDDVLAKSMALFDKAEQAVADDAELLERVKVARMPLTYARMFPRNGYVIDNNALRFQGEFAQTTDALEFLERMKKHGFATLREMEGDPNQMAMLCALFNAPVPVETISNGLLAVDIIPILGGRALRITDMKSGQCITAHNTSRSLFFPFCGGEETRIGGIFRMNGMFEQFSVKERSENAITLSAKVAGFDVTRKIRLLPSEPVAEFVVTATNGSDKPQEITLRSHLELDLGDLNATTLRFTDRTGAEIERGMAPIIANLREGEHYLDQQAPKGAWTFTGSKGLTVTQSFDDATLDFAWAYAYPDYLNDLETEIWLRRTTLAPGESITLRHAVEVRLE